MRRRDFLGAGLTGAAGTALMACGGGEGASSGEAEETHPRVQWRLASSFPRGLDTIFGGAEVFAERVEKLSGGRFTVRVYPSGELVPGLQVMDAVQSGTAQIGHTASYYYTGKNPAFAFDTCVPFGLTARQQAAWLNHGGGAELLAPLFDEFNILSLPAGNTGAQMGGWFHREITSPEDLKGLKIRIPGLGGEVMSRLGATVQVLAGGDIYAALERGAIDATEWVGPYDDEKLGFHKVAKYYYYPGWWEPGPSLSYYINKDAWAALPPTYQEIVRSAAAEAATWMQETYDQRNPEALKRIVESGVELRTFSDEVMQAARQATLEVMDELAAADERYAAVYDSWKTARDDQFSWFGTAELAYAQFAFSAR